MICPGGTAALTYDSNAPCEFARKLCVTCSEVDGVVRIKVQSNGLPNHCVTTIESAAAPVEKEWEVNFNPDTIGEQNYSTTDFSSSEATDAILCDRTVSESDKMNEASNYVAETRRML